MGVSAQLVALSRRPGDIRRFLRVAEELYRNDPLWVAPLRQDIEKVFSDRNPFFAHAEMELWVVSQEGKDVGRIAAILDRLQSEYWPERTGFFGFFESIHNQQVSHLLFEAVGRWAEQNDVARLLGPMNPSANDECGLLVDGFDRSPALMMSYNPRYYQALILAEGFAKAKDLLAFYIDLASCPTARLERVASRFRQRQPRVQIRPIRRQALREDLPKIKEIYNQAWSTNWGFLPMTDAEVDFMAERLAPLLTEGLAWIAEMGSEPVGFLLALPDFNEAIKPLRGRLLSPKLFGFLSYLFGRKVPGLARVIALGVKKRYRGRGIETVMLAEGLRVGARLGLSAAEASWVLEDNVKTRQTIEIFGGKLYKTYRLYARRVDSDREKRE